MGRLAAGMTALWSRLAARVRRLFDSEIRSLAKDSALMSAATASKVVVGFVQVAVVTRFLGTESYGKLAMITSITGFVALFLSARVWEWVTKFLTDARARRDVDEAGEVLRIGFRLSAGINALAFVVVVVLARPAAQLLRQPDIAALIAIFALTLLPGSITDTSAAVLRVLGHYRFLAGFGVASSVVRVGSLAVALSLGYGLAGAVIAYVATEVVLDAVQYWVTSGAFREAFGRAWHTARRGALHGRRREARSMLGYAFGIDTLKSFGSQADALLLGYVYGAREVAYFRVAMTVIDAVNRLATSLLMVAFPALARLAARGDAQAVLRLIRRSSLLLVAVGIPGCALLAALAPWIIQLASGHDYARAVPVLRVLAWGLLWVTCYWITPACMSVGKPRWAFQQVAATFGLKLAVIVPFTVWWGELGTAWSNVVFNASFVLLALVYLRRVTRFMRSAAFRPAARDAETPPAETDARGAGAMRP
jgi:O-antigen/teichoic acid export membrane protein